MLECASVLKVSQQVMIASSTATQRLSILKHIAKLISALKCECLRVILNFNLNFADGRVQYADHSVALPPQVVVPGWYYMFFFYVATLHIQERLDLESYVLE